MRIITENQETELICRSCHRPRLDWDAKGTTAECEDCGTPHTFAELAFRYATARGWGPHPVEPGEKDYNFTHAFTQAAEALEQLTNEERRRIIDALDKLYPGPR